LDDPSGEKEAMAEQSLKGMAVMGSHSIET